MTKRRRRPGLAVAGVKTQKASDPRLTLDETAQQSRHRLTGTRMIREDNGNLVERRVNMGESPLGWLARRKDATGRAFLEDYHVEAGDRLRADFTKGKSTPVVTQNWGAVPRDKTRAGPTDMLSLSEAALAARQRFERAVNAMGPDLADMAVRACCHLQGMEAAEKERGWPARSGKVVLKLALERLAAHYGLTLAGRRTRTRRAWRED